MFKLVFQKVLACERGSTREGRGREGEGEGGKACKHPLEKRVPPPDLFDTLRVN
jgi:hypothetical protein